MHVYYLTESLEASCKQLKLIILYFVGREASVCPEFQVCFFSVHVIVILGNIERCACACGGLNFSSGFLYEV